MVSAPLPPTSIFAIATPGVLARTAKMSRAPGSAASFSLSKCAVTSVDARSMTGAPLTLTLSVTPPGSELGVDGGGEAEPDVDALADDRRETRELERERVVARRHGRKAVGARLRRWTSSGWSSATARRG